MIMKILGDVCCVASIENRGSGLLREISSIKIALHWHFGQIVLLVSLR